MATENTDLDLDMVSADLYREETFTDRKVGSIQRLTPVTTDGEPDQQRAVVYVGQSQLMTPAGALPISFEIEAESLGEAAQKFGDNAKQAVNDTMERLQELRQEQSSSIAMPGSGSGSMGGFGGAASMPGGGGNIGR